MPLDRSEIQHRIEKVKAERDKFIVQANLQVANWNGQISALEELVAPPPPTSVEPNAVIPPAEPPTEPVGEPPAEPEKPRSEEPERDWSQDDKP